MRSFIAIDLSAEIKNTISQLQLELKRNSDSGRWKYIDNFHLTLKFLDDINLKQAALISKKLKAICNKTKEFSLKIDDIGFFPGRGCFRVLWLGLGGDTQSLKILKNNIESALEEIGIPKDSRQYTPHITIGQNIVFTEDFVKIKKQIDFTRFCSINVDRIFLFSSQQIGKKRVYTPINEYKLEKIF